MEVQLATIILMIGIGSTLCLDLWNLALKRIFGIPSLNFCLLGRWICHMPAGKFVHAQIATAEEKRAECAVGWIAHYSIGIALTGLFVSIVSTDWLARPTFLPALLYGIITVALPFLILQPALGLGIASSKTPRPTQARLKSLITHAVFGASLWICASGLKSLL